MIDNKPQGKLGFSTAPVFFTAISTILGAILFLRFGYATGTLGFYGVVLIIIVGHLVTIPTALALSEIATNHKVEGGGEYFIISRSFGLNIGATIGIALFLSQAISVAFYVIAFTEAFEGFFVWMADRFGAILPRQVISLPAMTLLAWLILKKGANMGVKALYFVVAILGIALVFFFLGQGTPEAASPLVFRNKGDFFMVFAIVFPAFTGMTAGVGLSGDLKKPAKSIPLGTISATVIGMILYIFIAWKLNSSASAEDLTNIQLIMGEIALFGAIVIPLGLGASTISSALGSVMVAPRTLQALGVDNSFPMKKFNRFIAKGLPGTNEPFNASLITIIIAFLFVALGNVNAVAEIISMFFMVTYGSLCLISFLYHFSADPSYRPSFKSKWYLSLVGFLMCIWLMFKINTIYAIFAIIFMALIYLIISNAHPTRKGLVTIFQGTMFQINRKIHIYLQKSKFIEDDTTWRPSVVCISKESLKTTKAFKLTKWISHKYGFGTFIQLIEGYLSRDTKQYSDTVLKELIEFNTEEDSKAYVDTLISPSYTSAVAQIVQLPGITGMENNMILFEYEKDNPKELPQIIDNFALVHAANYDVCILAASKRELKYKNGIHVWIKSIDFENANLMILLSYIINGHPDWRKGQISIFEICQKDKLIETKTKLLELVKSGRLPISPKNIEIIQINEDTNIKEIINKRSALAALTFIGYRSEQIKHKKETLFEGYDQLGDVLFVNSCEKKSID